MAARRQTTKTTNRTPRKKVTQTASPSPLLVSPDVILVRLESSIEKLTQATTELAVGVAAHTQRLDYVETQNRERQDDYKRLEARLGEETNKLTKHIDESVGKIAKEIAAANESRERGDKEILQRVEALEIWRWIIVGGGVVVAAIVTGFFVKVLSSILAAVGPAWLQQVL